MSVVSDIIHRHNVLSCEAFDRAKAVEQWENEMTLKFERGQFRAVFTLKQNTFESGKLACSGSLEVKDTSDFIKWLQENFL